LRFGFKDSAKAIKNVGQDRRLIRLILRREKRIKVLQELLYHTKERNNEMNVWLPHSEFVCYGQKVRVCEQIVRLLQEKNLSAQNSGQNFIPVGIIEAQLGYQVMARAEYSQGITKDSVALRLMWEIIDGTKVIEIA
jgi:hypothetical protein